MRHMKWRTERQPVPPQYTVEGTPEWQLVEGGKEFFARRDEKLRYDLVKRALQWSLDTDENGWFEPPRRMFGGDGTCNRDEFGAFVRRSDWELEEYLGVVSRDIVDGNLTGELSTLREYMDLTRGKVPPQYAIRYDTALQMAGAMHQRSKERVEFNRMYAERRERMEREYRERRERSPYRRKLRGYGSVELPE